MPSICTVPSCGREVRGNGYCQLHYVRLRRGKDILAPVGRSGPYRKEECKIDSCDRDYYAKDLCKFHYQRDLAGTTIDRPEGVRETAWQRRGLVCEGPECKQEAHTRGLCRSHYQQFHKGMELKPVRKNSKVIVTEDGRVCTMCKIAKPDDQFYVRNTGKLQSHCKRCSIARAAMKQWERKRGEFPEWAVAYLAKISEGVA